MKKSLLLLVSFMLTTLSALALPAKPTVSFTDWQTAVSSGSNFYLYNVDADLFVTGGNYWGTRACVVFNGQGASNNYVSYEDFLLGKAQVNGYAWEIGEEDDQVDETEGTVHCFSFANKTTSGYLTADGDGPWVDGGTNRPYNKWFVKENVGDNTFKLYYVDMGMFGLQELLTNGNTNVIYSKDDATNTTWALVSESEYEVAGEALNLYYIGQTLNKIVADGKALGLEKDWSYYDNLLENGDSYDEFKEAVDELGPVVNLGAAIVEAKTLDPLHDWSAFEAVYADPDATAAELEEALTQIKAYTNLIKGLTADDIDPDHDYNSFYYIYNNPDATVAELDSALSNLNAYKSLKANIDAAKVECPGIDLTAVEAVYQQTNKTNEELAAAQTVLDNLVIEYRISGASVENPADVSSKIVNRTFDTVGDFTGWSDGFGAGGDTDACAEVWHHTFDVHQDISGLPEGIYMVACNGYSRYNDNHEADYKRWKSGASSDTKIYMQSETLGQFFTPVMFVSPGGSIDEQIGTHSVTQYQYTDDEGIQHTLFCPNSMTAACDYFHDGTNRYHNEAFGPLAAGDVLRIGVSNPKELYWSIFDDFELWYYGNGIDAYQYWATKVIENAHVNFDGVYYGAPEKAFYDDVMATATTAETKEEISKAIEKISLAVDTVQASTEAYELYVAQCDEAYAWLAGGEHGEQDEVLKLTSYLETYAEESESESLYWGFPHGVSNYILNRVEGEKVGKICTADVIEETAFVKEMYEAAIRADLVDGTDLTGLIVNPGFEEANGKGWSLDTHNGLCTSSLTNWHGGSSTNYCAEAYQQKFDVYQEIEGVEDGLYEVSVQAFFRTGWNEGAWTAYQNDPEMTGDAKVYTYVYFNNFASKVRNVMEIQYDTNLADNCWTVTDSNPAKYTLNGMASASAAFSLPDENMNFTMKVYGLVTDGKIRLGIRNLEKDGDGGSWSLWDNFKLIYRAKNADILAEFLAEKLAQYSEYVEENTDYMTSVGSDYATDIIDATDLALESGDGDAMYEALSDLNDAIGNTEAHVAAYKAKDEAYDALNTALTDYEETASQAAIEQAEYLLSDEASGDDVIDNMDTEELQALVDAMNEAIAALKLPKGMDEATDENPVDCTSLIVNPSFEEGNLNGWQYYQGADTKAAENSNSTYTTEGCDGAYLFNTWSGTAPAEGFWVSQTLNALPAGAYELQVLLASDQNNKIYVSAANGVAEFVMANAKEVGQEGSIVFTVEEDAEVTIKVESPSWFKADNFRLTYFGVASEKEPTDVELAESAVDAAVPVAIYAADGSIKQALQPGVNIVVFSNGEVKKIYNKK